MRKPEKPLVSAMLCDTSRPISLRAWGGGTLCADRAIALTRACSAAFFNRHQSGEPSSILDRPSAAYPEVSFVK